MTEESRWLFYLFVGYMAGVATQALIVYVKTKRKR